MEQSLNEIADLPGLVRTTEAIAADASKIQQRESVLETFGQEADQFDEQYPYAPEGKRATFLSGKARDQATNRAKTVEAAERLVGSTLEHVNAAIEAARLLPSELETLSQRRNALGLKVDPSTTDALLARLLDEQREARLMATLAGADMPDVERLYERAVAAGDAGALRVLEREILSGLRTISTRKGDAVKNAAVFAGLRKRVEAAQQARVPEDLTSARKRLEEHAAKLRTWRLVRPNRVDMDGLELDWKRLKADRSKVTG
jgi:hypothetical protein